MKIVIVDTGCANLYSLQIAIQKIGYSPVITKDIDVIFQADKLILPGVGTVLSGMKTLYELNLIKIIQYFKNPVLGICLGMQLFFSDSEESYGVKMLNIMHASIVKFKNTGLSIPHTGWNTVRFNENHILFKGIKQESYFYFVHSYMLHVNKYTIAYSYYGVYFSAVIQKDNFFGVQFHPEKSGFLGSKLLNNFLEI